MRRPRRLLLAVPVLALLGVTACAPFHAGAAATVGDARIDTGSVRSATQTVLSQQPPDSPTGNAKPDAVQRDVLGGLVQLQVLQAMAARRGVTVGAAQVGTARTTLVGEILQGAQTPSGPGPAAQATRAQAVAAAAGFDLDTLARVQAYVQVLSGSVRVDDAQVGAAFRSVTDHRFYDVDVVQVASQQTAQAVAAALTSDPRTFDRIAASLGAGATNKTRVSAAQLEQQAGGPLKVGSVVGPGQVSATAYEILLVTGAGTRTLDQALQPGSTERQALQAQAFPAAYGAVATSLGVHVNPRFGAWMPTGQDALGQRIGAVSAGGVQLSQPLVAASPGASPAAGAGGTDGSGGATP